MKIWIPRLIMLAFALLLAYAVYWGYKNTRPESNGQGTSSNPASGSMIPAPPTPA